MRRIPSEPERRVHGAWQAAAVLAGLAMALSALYVEPRLTERITDVTGDGSGLALEADDPTGDAGPQSRVVSGSAGRAAGSADAGDGTTTGDAGASSGSADSGPSNLSCPDNNGGETDVGVSKEKISLASTEVRGGVGASFLGSARYGMQGVVQLVNQGGGVCGRLIDLRLQDDNWDPQLGKQYLDTFIESHEYLAFPVVPSSNGLDAASGESGSIDKADDPKTGSKGIPVIGTDGMLNSQYDDPWIWPVAASTATTMRIMARDAFAHRTAVPAVKSGSRKLRMGIIYDRSYPFGVEGNGAFVKQAERDGAEVPEECRIGLTVGQGINDYTTQVNQFNDACGEGADKQVDFVALLLEPVTALKWLNGNPFLGTTSRGEGLGAGGPQPLFDKNFIDQCGGRCNGWKVWTGFLPPIAPFSQKPEVQEFKRVLCSVDSHCEADALNAFTEGAYVGMKLVVEALAKTSPFLTRERLKETLNSMTLDTGLTVEPLNWSKSHHANTTMIAFTVAYSGGSASFQYVSDSETRDPCVTCNDPPLGS